MRKQYAFQSNGTDNEIIFELPSPEIYSLGLDLGRLFSAVFAAAFGLGAFVQRDMIPLAALFGLLSLISHVILKSVNRSASAPLLVLTPPCDDQEVGFRVVVDGKTAVSGVTTRSSFRLVPTIFPGGYVQAKQLFTIVFLEPSLENVPVASKVDLGGGIEACLELTSSPDEKEAGDIFNRLQVALGAPTT